MILKCGSAGQSRASAHQAASEVIKDAARAVASDIVHICLHGAELKFEVGNAKVGPSSRSLLALYRLRPPPKVKVVAKRKAATALNTVKPRRVKAG